MITALAPLCVRVCACVPQRAFGIRVFARSPPTNWHVILDFTVC